MANNKIRLIRIYLSGGLDIGNTNIVLAVTKMTKDEIHGRKAIIINCMSGYEYELCEKWVINKNNIIGWIELEEYQNIIKFKDEEDDK